MAKNGCLLLLFFLIAFGAHAQQPSANAIATHDSMTLAASSKYKDPSLLKRLFLGKNYRAAWAMPVTLPQFHLREMGFTIKELGGGQQTKSLRLLDKQGHEWVLRTVDKDVETALPPRLRNSFAEKIVQDMISAAHPYAPLTIPVFTKAAGVVAAEPVFFIVPDDPALGEYRELFKATMCMLEDREPTPDGSETDNTENLVEDLLKDETVQINEPAVLQARLLDMLIGDWDRHQDQWRWGFEKVEGIKQGYAIPRDRDQAYFYSKGLLVKVARTLSLPHLVGFARDTRKLKKLNAKSWNFDRTFLADLDAQDWQKELNAFTSAITDAVISEAVAKLPPEVYPMHGSLLQKKLMARRNSLPKDAARYYRFIASAVTVAGTDAAERFVITTSRDSVTVQQFGGAGFLKLVYNRTFHRSETHTVTILGLGGADAFVQSGTPSRIRVLLDGGTGLNTATIANNRRLRYTDSDGDAKAYENVLKKALRIKK